MSATAGPASGDTISTVAGNGLANFAGDGGPATAARIFGPSGVAALPDGSFLIADTLNQRIRSVSAAGVISTVAGSGISGSTGDGGLPKDASLSHPNAVAPLPGGGFLIADYNNNKIRKVSADGLTITTVAGTGTLGFTGDTQAANLAQLARPAGVSATADGGFLIADTGNLRIRKVDPGANPNINTVAGGGTAAAPSGDGGPATSAGLNSPYAARPTADGGFLIADTSDNLIRKVSAGGIITTVAGTGTGTPGFSGDGGPATAAVINTPNDVVPTSDGGFLIADTGNNRIRKVSAGGVITTVAGTGVQGYSGDGGDATSAQLSYPTGISNTPDGGFLIADYSSNRIRKVTPPSSSTAAPTGTGAPATATPATATPTTSPPPTTSSPPGSPPPPPKQGATVNVAPVAGSVLVRLPGATGYVALSSLAQIPVGSIVDATRGRVGLCSAAGARGGEQCGDFYGGAFRINQKAASPATDLYLTGGDPSACQPAARRQAGSPPPGRRRARGKVARRPRLRPLPRNAHLSYRHLWGDGHGKFVTHGDYIAGAERGTVWLTEDRCDGSAVTVQRGAVEVRDLALRRSVLVTAGHSYLARRARP